MVNLSHDNNIVIIDKSEATIKAFKSSTYKNK
jgi:hypothetical protein